MRFDPLAVECNGICFAGSGRGRSEALEGEFARCGFPLRVIWNSRSPFDSFLLKRIPHTVLFDRNIGFFNCSRAHYRILRTAYDLGDEWCWICEDDCRFMKDVERAVELMTSYPDDADLLLFDGIPAAKQTEEDISRIVAGCVDGWCRIDVMRSAACYAANRKAMKRLLWLYESAVDERVAGRKARICDQWFESRYMKGCAMYMCHPNAAVQQTVGDGRNSGSKWRLRGYGMLGVDLGEYGR